MEEPVLSEPLESIWRLLDADKYSKAEEEIAALSKADSEDPIVHLFIAICHYEKSDDLSCIEYMYKFLSVAPLQPKTHYAQFTIAVCLENLGLYGEALSILQKVHPGYPNREAELSYVREKFALQKQALAYIEASQ